MHAHTHTHTHTHTRAHARTHTCQRRIAQRSRRNMLSPHYQSVTLSTARYDYYWSLLCNTLFSNIQLCVRKRLNQHELQSESLQIWYIHVFSWFLMVSFNGNRTCYLTALILNTTGKFGYTVGLALQPLVATFCLIWANRFYHHFPLSNGSKYNCTAGVYRLLL